VDCSHVYGRLSDILLDYCLCLWFTLIQRSVLIPISMGVPPWIEGSIRAQRGAVSWTTVPLCALPQPSDPWIHGTMDPLISPVIASSIDMLIESWICVWNQVNSSIDQWICHWRALIRCVAALPAVISPHALLHNPLIPVIHWSTDQCFVVYCSLVPLIDCCLFIITRYLHFLHDSLFDRWIDPKGFCIPCRGL
jgi:hypothetical protein